ncbi:phosphopantetheine-binding protein [Streptomyces sp. NPDC059008]|uniref:phosphopantetheine-binding protein n=1 Tax=Streptomyces sp. NPDC059008 TaxID=3346693 RepID=UPI0036B17789
MRTFLSHLRPDADMAAVTSDSNLFELGILDSLAVVELIVFLERLIGAEIVIENYQLESFHTLAGISQVMAGSTRSNTAVRDADHTSTPGTP